MPPYPNFCGPTYRSQAITADAEECINWYVERLEVPGARAQFALYPTPGVRLRASIGDSPGYGIFRQSSTRLFVIAGTTLAEVASDYAVTVRGLVAQNGKPADLTWNGDGGGELLATVGGKTYNLDLATNVLTTVLTFGDFNGMMDGFFAVLDAPNSKVVISGLFDGLTWDPLQFIQRSDAPDPWRAMIVRSPEIWLIGEKTGSLLYNAGTAPFPFAPIQGAQIQEGIIAPNSLKWLNGPIWLTENENGSRKLVQAKGYTPVRISNHAFEWQVSRYDIVSDAEGFVYQSLGHDFYIINFPTEGVSWGWDQTTGLMHKRGTLNLSQSGYDVWHAQSHAQAYGVHLVMDRMTDGLYEMDEEIGWDFGTDVPIRRERIAPSPSKSLDMIGYDVLELDVQPGLGLTTGQGSDPVMLHAKSNDGGQTWGAYRSRSVGKRGEYKKRVRWTRLGSARRRVDKIVCSDPVPFRIVGAFLEAEQ